MQNGAGEFYDRATGMKFVPRGNNHVRLADQVDRNLTPIFYHSTFNVGLYDAPRAEAALGRMEQDGFNLVRVYLNGCCASGTISTLAGLSGPYLDNVVDFLKRAKAHHLFVMPTEDGVPEFGKYSDTLFAQCCAPFDGYNLHYLTPGGVRASVIFWKDFIQGLKTRNAPLEAIFAYELRNELYFDGNITPLNLASGTVTAANGHSYDMADPAAKRTMMDEGLVYWVNQSRSAILQLDPLALVSVGFFVPTGPNPTRVGDPREIFPYPAIAGSNVDFVDLHLYPFVGDLTLSQYVQNFGLAGLLQKPVIMGEFGAHLPDYPTVQQGAQVLKDWQIASCAFGFTGWLLWTWDSEEQSLSFPHWTATSADSSVERALAPALRPDPCQ